MTKIHYTGSSEQLSSPSLTFGIVLVHFAGRSLHHCQIFERATPLPLGFIVGPKELDFPLFRFDLVLVLLEFPLGSDVWVSHRLRETETSGEQRTNVS